MPDRRDPDILRRARDRRTSDRRSADRHTLGAGIRFLRAGSSTEQILSGELLDVSASGIRIALDEPLAAGEKVLVEVRDHEERCFNMTAEAVWVELLEDGRHQVGCELCVDLSDRQLRTLKRFAAAHAI